ncbi:hypothetical protein CN884_17800 [Ochrobactrum sp. 30A/1000/2015]|nr:hypothetical protein O206_10185 [Ochrobactrum sp. EGD-AQ16]MPR62420.1 hypothetical protein [Brucella intermedia]PJR90821.1 hypothetical protein CN881_17075 [Ochrobactrum sp. 721/2009]PJT15893.1 hypothetical protein CN880_05655 [Ochrobactrum sp. 720/2009]PJT20503.1 hypothetical protein CN884_17800 [Ochrobactrum sp. 30A/1000/2015]PJT25713.1 hypothetical protein CN879_01620 [Ochrobactrum sp. 715/2009]PJT29319.1 hypothetical protein CN878_10415 [Ochrobactrum sp. 695/2009]PJT35234.1 hypothetic
MVLAFGIDKLNPGNPDITVGARSVFLNRRRSKGSANGRYLLIVTSHAVGCLLPDGMSPIKPQLIAEMSSSRRRSQ